METTAGTGAEMIIDSPPVVSIPQKKDNIGGETNMMDVVDDILHSEWEKHLEEEKVEKKI